MKIGYKVLLAKSSQFANQLHCDASNPLDVFGWVKDIDISDDFDDILPIYVLWENGLTNYYDADDLEIVHEDA